MRIESSGAFQDIEFTLTEYVKSQEEDPHEEYLRDDIATKERLGLAPLISPPREVSSVEPDRLTQILQTYGPSEVIVNYAICDPDPRDGRRLVAHVNNGRQAMEFIRYCLGEFAHPYSTPEAHRQADVITLEDFDDQYKPSLVQSIQPRRTLWFATAFVYPEIGCEDVYNVHVVEDAVWALE